MGWKASMLIVQNTSEVKTAEEVIQNIDDNYYEFVEEISLDSCINPRDEAIYVGFYQDNIILTFDAENILMSILDGGSSIEHKLAELCPDGETVGVFCQSTTNMHGYFINQNGDRVRHKLISFESPKMEFGEKIEEEIAIYDEAKVDENGVEYWQFGGEDSHKFEENQLMEKFTFGVAKRLLGVQLDHSEGDELMFQVKFKKFVQAEPPSEGIPAPSEEEITPPESTTESIENTSYQRPERTTERKKRTPISPPEKEPVKVEETTTEFTNKPPEKRKTRTPKPKNENGLNLPWYTIPMFLAALYLLFKLLN